MQQEKHGERNETINITRHHIIFIVALLLITLPLRTLLYYVQTSKSHTWLMFAVTLKLFPFSVEQMKNNHKLPERS